MIEELIEGLIIASTRSMLAEVWWNQPHPREVLDAADQVIAYANAYIPGMFGAPMRVRNYLDIRWADIPPPDYLPKSWEHL